MIMDVLGNPLILDNRLRQTNRKEMIILKVA